jgi:hypothetical protein
MVMTSIMGLLVGLQNRKLMTICYLKNKIAFNNADSESSNEKEQTVKFQLALDLFLR